MPNYIRWRERGASYFFTVVTQGRRPLFDEPLARRMLRRAFVEVRRRRSFDMFACVMLPDHLHCIWKLPDCDDDFSDRWSAIKRLFSKAYVESCATVPSTTASRAKHRELGIWQRRFWEHRIRDEADWLRLRDYIHFNPVKHEYVSDPRDWPWSSIHRHIRLGWLDSNWPGSTPPDMAGDFGE